ncbi:MAG: hypothetical protein Tsb0010_14740 [Parvularculaceae bacterium]
MKQADAVIIDGGVEGAAAAALLARAGLGVLLLMPEAGDPGAAYADYPAPFAAPLSDEIWRKLELDRFSPRAERAARRRFLFGDGESVDCANLSDVEQAIAGFSSQDGSVVADYFREIRRHRARLDPLLRRAGTSNAAAAKSSDLLKNVIDSEEFRRSARFFWSGCEEALSHVFRSERTRRLLASSAFMRTFVSPRAPTSSLALFEDLRGAWPCFVQAGAPSARELLLEAAQYWGATVEHAPMTRIIVRDGRVLGVDAGDENLIRCRAAILFAQASRKAASPWRAVFAEDSAVENSSDLGAVGITIEFEERIVFPDHLREQDLLSTVYTVCGSIDDFAATHDEAMRGLWAHAAPFEFAFSVDEDRKFSLNIRAGFAPDSLARRAAQAADAQALAFARQLAERALKGLGASTPDMESVRFFAAPGGAFAALVDESRNPPGTVARRWPHFGGAGDWAAERLIAQPRFAGDRLGRAGGGAAKAALADIFRKEAA